MSPATQRKPQNHFDALVDRMSQRLVEVIDRFPEEDAPFGAVKLTPQEQLDRYLEIRDDPSAWIRLLTDHGIDSVVKYALQMEGRINAYTE